MQCCCIDFVKFMYYSFVIVMWKHSNTSDSAYSYRFLCKVICLSSVTLVHPLKRLRDLDAIWQAHLWGLMTHCVRWDT